MQHISSKTRAAIFDLVGSFDLVSFSSFEADGEKKTRYTVRKPRGMKQIHLIGHENGVITRAF